MTDVDLAKAIYEHHRASARRSKRSSRMATWDELAPPERARKIEIARRCIAQYARSDAREVPLTP